MSIRHALNRFPNLAVFLIGSAIMILVGVVLYFIFEGKI